MLASARCYATHLQHVRLRVVSILGALGALPQQVPVPAVEAVGCLGDAIFLGRKAQYTRDTARHLTLKQFLAGYRVALVG